MLNHTDRPLAFPDSLISHSQCLAGAIERRAPSVPDLQALLTELPAEAGTPGRLIVRRVLTRVFARFVSALDSARDAASIRAFVAWSGADPASEHWRDDLFHLVGVWSAAHAARHESTPVVTGVADIRIRHVIDALDRRYTEPRLTLGDVALAGNLSPCHAARLLKRQTGRGFVEHLHQRRLAAARGYLIETTLSIKEIADRVGYKSASELGRHFKRSCGMTPREYRARSHDE
jgi:AraC-like DNA-binding protein